MAGARVSRPYGTSSDFQSSSDPAPSTPGHQDARLAGASQLASLAANSPQTPFKLPPKTGIHVRTIWSVRGIPLCEVWRNGRRLYPPPRLIKRADSTRDDCFYRVGDTIDCGKTHTRNLKYYGFSDPKSDVFTALLFFLLDIDADADYRVIHIFKNILPDPHDAWAGSVVFCRCLVSGGTIIPFPNQRSSEEDLASCLTYLDLAQELEEIQKLLQDFVSVFLNFLWALLGGWEVKAAGEVAEKYVAKEVLRRALKYIRPKFLVLIKAYITGFVKELVKQIYHQIIFMIRAEASSALLPRVNAAADTITVDQIHWLQSSTKLNSATELATIRWEECNKKGIEEALTPFWKLFSGVAMANGPLYRFVTACYGYIDTFFFDLGLTKTVKLADGLFGKKMRDSIKELVAGVIADWMNEIVSSNKHMSESAARTKFQDFTLKRLTDGTLVELAVKYFEQNWDKLATSAVKKAEGELLKAVNSAQKEEAAAGASESAA